MEENELKLKQMMDEKKEAIKVRQEQNQILQEQRKEELTRKNKENEEIKRKVIEEKIQVKEESVKELRMKKAELIEQKVKEEQVKRSEKKSKLVMEKEKREVQTLEQLEKIKEENLIYEEKKKEKMNVQIQVKIMREQLMMKKQKLINELRDLRKEYHVNKDLAANQSGLDYKEQRELNYSATLNQTDRIRNKATSMSMAHDTQRLNPKKSLNLPKKPKNNFQTSESNFQTTRATHKKKNSTSKTSIKKQKNRSTEFIDAGIVIPEMVSSAQAGRKSPTHGSFAAKVMENIEASSKLQQQSQNQPLSQQHRRIYTEVFNAYLSPNALNFLNMNGISKRSVNALYQQDVVNRKKLSKTALKPNYQTEDNIMLPEESQILVSEKVPSEKPELQIEPDQTTEA